MIYQPFAWEGLAFSPPPQGIATAQNPAWLGGRSRFQVQRESLAALAKSLWPSPYE